MSSSGPSGRSPYPSRSRRRLSSSEATDTTPNVSTSFGGSPFFTGNSGPNLLAQARMSPAWSPSSGAHPSTRRSQQHQPRRFFEDSVSVVEQDQPMFVATTTTNNGRVAKTGVSSFLNSSSQIHRKSVDGSILDNPMSSVAAATNGSNNHRKLTPATLRAYDSSTARSNGAQDSVAVGGMDVPSYPTLTMDGIDLTQLRRLAENASGSSLVASSEAIAACYAGLLYAKTQSPEDAFLYAQTLSKNGQEKRAVRLLERSGLLDKNFQPFEMHLEAVILASRSLATLDEWEQVLELLENASILIKAYCHSGDDHAWSAAPPLPLEDGDDIGWATFANAVCPQPHTVHPISRLCLWRGRAYLETGHPTRAAIYWKRALMIDSKCVEALDLLLGRRIVSPQEAYELIRSLRLDPEVEWLQHYYLARIDLPPQDLSEESLKSDDANLSVEKPFFSMNGTAADTSSLSAPTPFKKSTGSVETFGSFDKGSSKTITAKSAIQRDVDKAFHLLWDGYKLNQSSDVLAMAANRCYRSYDLHGALKYCEELAVVDPLCPSAGYVYVATLVALSQKRGLFDVAHDWVDASPKSARAWFAVGSYYYACERYRIAQRHFCRATRLDPRCPEAWIAFGCSFAACDESDQALASFRAAQRLAPGDHSSLLYMGMEYLRTNHLALAQHFLISAFKTSGGDPLSLHELGVLAFHKGEHEVAIQWYLRCLGACQHRASLENTKAEELIDACKDNYWEPTLFNLGHCYRKTRSFILSVLCFERCLALNPNHPSIYAALAFTRHLMGDVDNAIDLYHQALSRKPDDPFSSEMLNRALHEALSSKLFIHDAVAPTANTDNTNSDVSKILGKPKEEGIASRTAPAAASNLEWSRRDASVMSDDGMNLSMDSSNTDAWT